MYILPHKAAAHLSNVRIIPRTVQKARVKIKTRRDYSDIAQTKTDARRGNSCAAKSEVIVGDEVNGRLEVESAR